MQAHRPTHCISYKAFYSGNLYNAHINYCSPFTDEKSETP